MRCDRNRGGANNRDTPHPGLKRFDRPGSIITEFPSNPDLPSPHMRIAMPSSDSKTKIRPQQSCLKCRERKVKVRPPPTSAPPSSPRVPKAQLTNAQCDRSVPCHACIIRGLEAECTYLSTAEDRAHISQAEIIERLRREVAQLRGQLSQGPRPSLPRPSYARGHTEHSSSSSSNGPGAGVGAGHSGASASGGGSADGGSWPGSSPSSTTTMTSSVTVTSPDSTGSENGAHMQTSAYPVQGQFAQSVERDIATGGKTGLGGCEFSFFFFFLFLWL